MAHPQPMSFCKNDLGSGFLLNHALSMPGGGNGGCGPIMQWVPCGDVVDHLFDSL